LIKGSHKKLNVTKEARHRIMVGLGWDPADEMGVIEKMKSVAKSKEFYHDLDLACYIYDKDGNNISSVSAEPGQSIDHTGNIYHSGDNVEGYGEGDDEEISVELKDLNANIHHIIFTAQIRTGHVFREIDAAEIRLADGYTNHNFLQTPLIDDEGLDKNAYIFVHLYRAPDAKADQWMLHHVAEYMNANNIDAWHKRLKDFLIEEDSDS